MHILQQKGIPLTILKDPPDGHDRTQRKKYPKYVLLYSIQMLIAMNHHSFSLNNSRSQNYLSSYYEQAVGNISKEYQLS